VADERSDTLFALRVLRAHGIAKAILVPQVMYALSAWWGFVSFLKKSLESVVRKANKYGFLPPSYDNLEDLSLISDEKLFFLCNIDQIMYLNSYYLLQKSLERTRSHYFTLSSDISNSKRRNFIYRMLFTDIY